MRLLKQQADEYRHVEKTDTIKDLVITEEGSIAKGIRRVVAVTGHDAYEVQRKGKEFDSKLETIKGLQGKAKEAAMKPFLTVSYYCHLDSWITFLQ